MRGVGRSPSIADLYAEVLHRVLPDVDGEELYRRVAIGMYGMLSALAASTWPATGTRSPSEGLDPRFVDQLVVFTSAGLAAGQSGLKQTPPAWAAGRSAGVGSDVVGAGGGRRPRCGCGGTAGCRRG